MKNIKFILNIKLCIFSYYCSKKLNNLIFRVEFCQRVSGCKSMTIISSYSGEVEWERTFFFCRVPVGFWIEFKQIVRIRIKYNLSSTKLKAIDIICCTALTTVVSIRLLAPTYNDFNHCFILSKACIYTHDSYFLQLNYFAIHKYTNQYFGIYYYIYNY